MRTGTYNAVKSYATAIAMLLLLIFGINKITAQENGSGRLNVWTTGKVSSREKFDEILPTRYKMRVSKHKGFDRIVFEFSEKEVPEYEVRYQRPPILIDNSHIEDPATPAKDEIIKVGGRAFIIIDMALQFDGIGYSSQFAGRRQLPMIRDIETVDWFENFFSFVVGAKAKNGFRVQELSDPTRLMIDLKH